MRPLLAALLVTLIATALSTQPQQRFGEKVEVKLVHAATSCSSVGLCPYDPYPSPPER